VSAVGTAPARAQPGGAARPQRAEAAARRRPSGRRGILGGVLWIVVFAAVLGGVVALNVAVLQLNLRLDGLSRERVDLKATNAELSGRLAGAGSPFAVERLAQQRLNLVQATSEQTSYVQLGR
jgi:hypothetical protein